MIVQHYKGGIYEVISDNATHSETEENLVVYKSVATGRVWVRPAEMFFGDVVVDGKQVPRFKEV